MQATSSQASIIDPRLNHVTQLLAAEKLDAAEAICETLSQENAEDPFLLHAQGLIDYMRKRYDRAIQLFQRSIAKIPNNPNFYGNLGEALRRKGEPLRALRAFQDALLLEPKFAKAHLGLGNSLADLKRYPEARTRFQFLIELHPQLPAGYHYLGVMLTALERPKEAIPLIRKAIALKPGYSEARFSLADALEQAGQTEDALALYQELLTENPTDSSIHNNYANLLRSLGRSKEAESHLREAVKHDPNSISAYYNRTSKELAQELSPEQLQHLENRFADPNLRKEDRSNLHFTLAKYYEGHKDYDQAFSHYQTGNDIDRRKEPYITEHQAKLTEIFKNFFTRDFFASRTHFGCESQMPVFIFGMPRSGTTLVEQILSSHPRVYGAGELKYISQTMQLVAQQLSGKGYPVCLNNLDPVQACILGEGHMDKLRGLVKDPAERANTLRITDKMPGNFINLGLVALLLPKAKLIHCRRDPMDSCLSCYTQHFTQVIAYSRRLEDLGHYYQCYEELMAHWHQVLPLPILDVQYEEIVQAPETMSRRIIEFVGLDWHDDCLNFHQTQRQVKTASVEQVRQPIYTSSVGKWRRYEKHLAPLIKALGSYAPALVSA